MLMWIVLAGFAAAPVVWALGRARLPGLSVLAAAVPLTILILLGAWIEPVSKGEILVLSAPWVPSLGVSVGFRLDGLSLAMALLISGIGTLIMLYTGAYLRGHPRMGTLLALLLGFMAAMLGLVLADDLIVMFVFWELTSITSFLLVGFENHKPNARRNALQALVITGGGGLCLMAAMLMITAATGTHSLNVLLAAPQAAGEALAGHGFGDAALVLLLLAAFTKSAQVPFHSWLPSAMAAPTPVSAFLHSATMVKAGVYLLARLWPVLHDHPAWTVTLGVVGGLTLLIGALLAALEHDLKRLLAGTTIASLGLMVLMLGIAGSHGVAGAVLYLAAHALFKGALFMVAGSVDHGAGSRDATRLGGLARSMPLSFAAATLAAASLAGVLFTFGFVAKEALYKATTQQSWPLISTTVVLLGNALMIAAMGQLWRAFVMRPPPDAPASLDHAHEGRWPLWGAPLVLSVLSVAGGLAPHTLTAPLLGPMAAMIAGTPVDLPLHTWPHELLPFVLSLVTLALGVALAWRLLQGGPRVERLRASLRTGPDRAFDWAVRGLVWGADRFRLGLQHGRLQRYLGLTLLLLAAVLLLGPLSHGALLLPHLGQILQSPGASTYEIILMIITVLGATAVLLSRTKIQALISVSVIGLSVGLIFLALGAPDLAFTQMLVETLSTVILTLVLIRVPLENTPLTAGVRTPFGLGVAVLVGAGVAGLLTAVTAVPFDSHLSGFFNRYSYAEAHGRNVVNVILVDFRGLDTLGEITVVLITGLAASLLIRRRPGAPGSAPAGPSAVGLPPRPQLPRPQPPPPQPAHPQSAPPQPPPPQLAPPGASAPLALSGRSP